MSNRVKIAQIVSGVYTFYEREASEFALVLWMDALQHVDAGLVESALLAHIQDPVAGRFMPKPADVIRLVSGSADDDALIAWGAVLECARHGGREQDGLSEPTKMALKDLGGMSVVCRADEAHNGFLQRRFVDAFKAYSRAGERGAIEARARIGMSASDRLKKLAS